MSAHIHSIVTALPDHAIPQSDIANYMVKSLDLTEEEEKKLRILYRASGIQTRHSVLSDYAGDSQQFFKENEPVPATSGRMDVYQKWALKLSERASLEALNKAQVSKDEITHIITISCTGMYAPGLDIELIQALQLESSTQRTSVNFMGCYAAFHGLRAANQILAAEPKANILMVSVELCTLHMQHKKDDENLLANAIFADGAAALIINSSPGIHSLEIQDFFSDLALSGKQEMGWNIGNHGFEMKLTEKVPDVIKSGIEKITQTLLKKVSLTFDKIDLFAIHPGGKRILEVIEEKLGICKERNAHAREVLKNYGNMSSPTVLFVLKSIMESLQPSDNGRNILSLAFGPGLTMESAILKAHVHA